MLQIDCRTWRFSKDDFWHTTLYMGPATRMLRDNYKEFEFLQIYIFILP